MKPNLFEHYGIETLSLAQQKRIGVEMPLGKASTGKSTYEIITNIVIDLIEKSDLPPWQKPWSVNQSGERNFPMNYDSKKAYTGVNNFLLTMLMDLKKHDCPYFLTFKQVEKYKGRIIKGASSYPICFYTNDVYRDKVTQKTIARSVWEKLPQIQQTNYEPSFTLKYYNAFNAQDIQGIDFGDSWKPRTLPVKEQIESCENIVKGMPNRPEIKNGGDIAAYYPSLDIIKMPLINYFDKEQFYYAVLFHEIIHSTGSPSRLEREEKKKRKSFGDSFYAYEELIAEMGACYLCGEGGILYHNLKNSATYIKDWKTQVKNYLADDPKFFFKACADAQRGADYILGKSDPLIYAKFTKNTVIFEPKAKEKAVLQNESKDLKPKRIIKKVDTEKLTIELSKVKNRVIENSKFKEKIASELKAYLSSQGLGSGNSETDRLKRQIKFYKNIIKGDTSDFKGIATRLGYGNRKFSVRKKKTLK